MWRGEYGFEGLRPCISFMFEIRSPICTVAEDPTEELRLCMPTVDGANKGGGINMVSGFEAGDIWPDSRVYVVEGSNVVEGMPEPDACEKIL